MHFTSLDLNDNEQRHIQTNMLHIMIYLSLSSILYGYINNMGLHTSRYENRASVKGDSVNTSKLLQYHKTNSNLNRLGISSWNTTDNQSLYNFRILNRINLQAKTWHIAAGTNLLYYLRITVIVFVYNP